MVIRVKLPNGKFGKFPDGTPHEKIESVLRQQFPPTEQQSEIPSYQSGEKERLGFKGLGADTIDMLGNALKGGIGFLGRAPGEAKELVKDRIKNPLSMHNEGQVLASLAEGGKSLINLPHKAIAELGRKELIPDWLKKYNELPFTHIPEDTGIEKALGLQPTRKSDELVRAVPMLAGGATSLAKVIGKGLKTLKGPDLKQAIRETQSKVNAITEKSGNIFDHIENTLEKEGKNVVSVDKNLIDSARSMLSNKFNNIIDKAEKGDYKAVRKLQSALGAKERKGLASDNLGDIDQAENIGVVRDAINQAIQDHLEKNGFEDLAEMLEKNRNEYANIKKTYFSTPQLAKVFGKSQEVPKNPMTLLTTESTEMKRFFDAHPEMETMMKKALKHNKTKKAALLGLGILGGGTTAGITSNFLGKH